MAGSMNKDLEQIALLLAADGCTADEIRAKTGLTEKEATEIWQDYQKAKDGAGNFHRSSKG